MENYTTSTGHRVLLKGLPSFQIEKINSRFIDPVKPQYDTVTEAGDVQKVDHNETTLEVEGDPVQTAKNKKAWAAYTEKRKAVEEQRSEHMMRLIVMRGIEFTMPDNDDWEMEEVFCGVDPAAIPPKEKPMERKYYYAMHEVFGSPQDVDYIMQRVMMISGVPEEDVARQEAMFQDILQGETTEQPSTA